MKVRAFPFVIGHFTLSTAGDARVLCAVRALRCCAVAVGLYLLYNKERERPCPHACPPMDVHLWLSRTLHPPSFASRVHHPDPPSGLASSVRTHGARYCSTYDSTIVHTNALLPPKSPTYSHHPSRAQINQCSSWPARPTAHSAVICPPPVQQATWTSCTRTAPSVHLGPNIGSRA